jgi:hypothetical protein
MVIIIKKLRGSRCNKGIEKRPLYTAGGGIKIGAVIVEKSSEFPKGIQIRIII